MRVASSSVLLDLRDVCHVFTAQGCDSTDVHLAESHTAAAAAVQQSTAAALLLKGLPWKRAAAPSLEAVSALTHLVCHGDAPAEERCLAFAQLAQHAAEHRGCRAAEQVLPIPHLLHYKSVPICLGHSSADVI